IVSVFTLDRTVDPAYRVLRRLSAHAAYFETGTVLNRPGAAYRELTANNDLTLSPFTALTRSQVLPETALPEQVVLYERPVTLATTVTRVPVLMTFLTCVVPVAAVRRFALQSATLVVVVAPSAELGAAVAATTYRSSVASAATRSRVRCDARERCVATAGGNWGPHVAGRRAWPRARWPGNHPIGPHTTGPDGPRRYAQATGPSAHVVSSRTRGVPRDIRIRPGPVLGRWGNEEGRWTRWRRFDRGSKARSQDQTRR